MIPTVILSFMWRKPLKLDTDWWGNFFNFMMVATDHVLAKNNGKEKIILYI